MAARKTSLSVEQYDQINAQLMKMHDDLQGIRMLLLESVANTDRAVTKSATALSKIDDVRYAVEALRFRQHGR